MKCQKVRTLTSKAPWKLCILAALDEHQRRTNPNFQGDSVMKPVKNSALNKFFCAALSVLGPSFAQADSSCLEQASNNELVSELSRRLGTGGGGDGGGAIQVKSSVNLTCIDETARLHFYRPDYELLLRWAKSCRGTVGEDCRLVSSSSNSACVTNLTTKFWYRPDANQLEGFVEACLDKTYSCK
jgi:hypothetical protein